MKTTFIYLGVVALSFNYTIEAKVLEGFHSSTQLIQVFTTNEGIDTSDAEIFNPNSVIITSSERRIEEVVAENILVTEFAKEVYQPIGLESTIEDVINENNMIIENESNNEVYSLNFEKIATGVQNIKVVNKNTSIINDLKL